MNTLIPTLLTITGLMLFEIISSVDNAIINSEVLASLPKKNRRWFLRWGLLFAVLGMRGVLPWLIVWLAVPTAGILGPFQSTFNEDIQHIATLHTSGHFLLMTAGIALFLIFLYWFILEQEFPRLQAVVRNTILIVTSIIFLGTVGYLANNPVLYRSMTIGIVLFLILLASKRLAALPRHRMSGQATIRAKMVYLEVLDSIFSIEAVLGAFAFTFSVPSILIGNGLGALIVRFTTARRGKEIRHIIFLKRGAMYALGLLGLIMVCDGLGADLPGWVSFLTTIIAMGIAYLQKN